MEKRIKRISAIILIIQIILQMSMPLISEAVTGTSDSRFNYSINSDKTTITVTKYIGTDTEVVIPSAIDGYNVTSIGNAAFKGCKSLTSIKIPEGITSIGSQAFYGCSGLTSIEIPEGVTSIGERAFVFCRLTSISIPKSVTSIGDYAFHQCTNLTRVEILEGVTNIGVMVFSLCSSLTSIEIPESVTSIGDSAFYKCSSLTSIEIPEGVTSIGDYAFSGCSSLTSIQIPKSVTSIGKSAFNQCKKLTSIEIPEGVTSIGDRAFYNCKSLASIEISEGVTSIGDYAFSGCSSLTSIEIPEGVTSIGNYAFEYCSSLTSISISKSVTSIGEKSFYGCSSLTDIEVNEENEKYKSSNGVLYTKDGTQLICYPPKKVNTEYTILEGVITIGDETFRMCNNLKSIKIPESVTSIGSSAFYKCESLTSISIPKSVRSIGSSAFSDCTGLTSIEIPEGVTSIGNSAFFGCSSLKSISIPKSVISIGIAAFYSCSSLTRIEIPEGVTSIGDGAFNGCFSLTSIEIPESVTSIGNSAFYCCISLISIEIPESVTSIGNSAFMSCSKLTSIKIPKGVTNIDDQVFERCEKLTNIEVDEKNEKYKSIDGVLYTKDGKQLICYPPKKENTEYTILGGVTSIAKSAFFWCDNLTSIAIPEGVINIGDSAFVWCDNLTSIEIPKSVTSIGSSAFYNCKSLTRIEIPESVTSIGSEAFAYCGALKRITIPEGVISIGMDVFEGSSKVIIKCKSNSTAHQYAQTNNIQYELDDMAPTLTVEYSTTSPTNKDVEVTIKSNEELKGVTGWTLSQDMMSLSKTYTSNASENVTVKDLLGNTATANVSVANIDRIAPTLTVEYSTKNPTNQDVEVTIKSNEKVQKVDGWTLASDSLSLSKTYTSNASENVTVKDLLGNTATAQVKIDNIDKLAPTLTVEYSTTNPTNQNVVVTIKSNEKIQKVQGWTLASDGLSLSKTYTSNGSESVTVKDLVGNTTTASVSVTNIDRIAPTLTVEYSTTNVTNQNVVVTIKSNKELRGLNGWTLSSDRLSLSKTYTSNVNENVTVLDMAGNSSTAQVKIENIDKTAPTLTVEYSTKNATNQNVVVTIKANEKVQAVEGWTLSSNGLSLSKTYTSNGSENVTVKDLLGNTATANVSVSNIDRIAPTLTVEYSTTNVTNQNVVVTIKSNEKVQAVNGWTISSDTLSLSKTYTSNVSETVSIKDLAGNGGTVQVKIDNIDKVAPTLTVEYSTKNITKENVKVTIKSNEKVQALEGWTLSSDKLSLSKTYSSNVSETVSIKDLAGNSSTTQVKIQNIDKLAPTLTVEYSTTNVTNQNVVVTIKSNKKVQAVDGWSLSQDMMSLNKTYTSNVTENVTVLDLVGNSSTAQVKIDNIDKIAPTLTVEYSTTNITNQNVLVTIKSNEKVQAVDGWTLSNDKLSLSKTYTSNVNENITVLDLAGNGGSAQVKIDNIDKIAPTLTVQYSTTDVTNQNVVVTIKSNEKVQPVDGWTLSSDKLSLSKTYTSNVSESVTIKDLVGNSSTAQVKIENIDKVAPTLTVEYSTTNVTKENVKVTIKSNEKVQAVEGWTLSNDKLSLSKTYTSNVTENVTVLDLVGNSSTAQVKIDNIDKIAPTLTVEYSTTDVTNQNVTVTIKSNEKLQGLTGWTLSNDKLSLSKTYTSNVNENVTVLDLAGNGGTAQVKIENIDKVAPTLTVEYSTTNVTNQNVKVTIKSNEKVQPVEGWTLSSDKLSLSKTYTSNVNENVTIKDLVGNSSTANIIITNIDTIAPTLTVEYSTKNSTNKDVVVTIKSNEKVQLVEGWTLSSDGLSLSKTYTSNVSENVTVLDLVGNSSSAQVKIDNIDKLAPTLTVEYSTKNPTNKDVVVTIKSNEKVQAVDGWTLSSDKLSLSKTYTSNVSESVRIKDLVGNSSIAQVKVSNIDKVAPKVEGVENEKVYNSVTIKVTDENLNTVILTKDGEEISYQEGITIKEKGTYMITATDKAENSTKVTFTIVEKAEMSSTKYTIDEENKYILGMKVGLTKEEIRANLTTNIGYKLVTKDGQEVTTQKIATGMKIQFETGESYELVVTGDTNGDGKISTTDITKIKKHIIQKELLQGCYEKAGNVNTDTKISVTDLAKIKKALVGLTTL